MSRASIVRCLGLASLFLTVAAHAGGIKLQGARIETFRAPSGEFLVAAGARFELCFVPATYTYSGRDGERGFIVLQFRPSSRVDSSNASVFVLPADGPDRTNRGLRPFEVTHCHTATAPRRTGTYTIQYSEQLMFPSDVGARTWSDEEATAAAIRAGWVNRSSKQLVRIRVSLQAEVEASDVRTYLQLDGQTPGVKAHVEPGLDRPAPIFSWSVRPPGSDVEHRYRLYPVEADWSQWSKQTSTSYHYLAPGGYQFQVATRVRGADGSLAETRQAQYQFVLEQPLIAKPLLKAAPGAAKSATVPTNLSDLYKRSRALVVGVSRFSDPRLGPLPYTPADTARIGKALKNSGFDVTPLSGTVTRSELVRALDRFTRSATLNERLIVYLSTHGFADPLDPTRGYVVTSDCRLSEPATCLSLNELDSLIAPALKAQPPRPDRVRHLLILLDACSSGLGVIAKSGTFTEIDVATRTGAHMMTAGLVDQPAEQDPALGLSTFTHFLVKGIDGEADYTLDGTVSLSELLVYVRYNVASRTAGRQTPMIGRLSGAGEMIFRPTDRK